MKTSYPIKNLLLKKISKFRSASVFTVADFTSLGSRAAVDKALSRLAREGVIRRIGRSLYVKPGKNASGTIPSPEAIAAAIARKTDSRVIPTGALAANILGLSTQVPAKLIFLTDGHPRSVQVGGRLLIFRHSSPRTVSVAGRTSAVVFQAIRYLGREGITETVIKRLKTALSAEDKCRLRRDIKHAVGWMKPYLIRITERDGPD